MVSGTMHRRAVPEPDHAGLGDDPRFVQLRSRFRRFVFPVAAAFLGWYLLYVVLSAFARDLLGIRVYGSVNVALVFGLLQFVTTFVVALRYARFARTRLDPLAAELADTAAGDR
ncbi:DUF485 domain-containing protein [Actinocatenispora rupis]|uniref:Clumping factor B n=1 Tax=Actinocatenispora rupis TaxID=519421 RepID=A0A8J3J0W5_9ACTN|nr:DUF485 domain-containing protein [Actinocatenispora rupis]GID09887.1 clumping factor B [Actinocatenispora rupis]